MSDPKFEVCFDLGAYREYGELDGSIAAIVDRKLEELEHRADVIGKPLGNTVNAKLAGCREIKLRDAGIRIVYCVTDQRVDILRIVFILAVERRANDYVFRLADGRSQNLRQLSPDLMKQKLENAPTRKPAKRKNHN